MESKVSFPTIYSKIVVEDYKIEALKVHTLPFDIDKVTLANNQFIATTHATPINPLDLQKINGKTAAKAPFTPGSECCGRVVYAKSEEAQKLVGKNVVMSIPQGAWSSIVVGSIENCIVIPEDSNLSIAACCFINPLTAIGLVETAIAKGAKGVAITAANSALGAMIKAYAQKKGLKVLGVVRSEERVKQLKEKGWENVLSSDDAEFGKKFKEVTESLKITACLDCVAGPLAGVIFNNLPNDSTLINFGSLDDQDMSGINPYLCRWGNQSIEGFVLFRFLGKLQPEDQFALYDVVAKGMNDDFSSKISQEYPFQDVQTAVKQYVGNMSEGQIILKPSL